MIAYPLYRNIIIIITNTIILYYSCCCCYYCCYEYLYHNISDTVVVWSVVGRRVVADRDHLGRRVGWRRHGMTSTPSPTNTLDDPNVPLADIASRPLNPAHRSPRLTHRNTRGTNSFGAERALYRCNCELGVNTNKERVQSTSKVYGLENVK